MRDGGLYKVFDLLFSSESIEKSVIEIESLRDENCVKRMEVISSV